MSAPRNEIQQAARSTARLAAVQGLYQMDIAGTDINAVIHDLTISPLRDLSQLEAGDGAELPQPDATFLAELLRGVVRLQRDIDPMVDGQLAKGWRLARVDSILRAVLRSAVFELIERREVPARVVINEYIEIARAFLGHDEPRVVNGVLDKLARKLRPDEFQSA